MSAIGIDQALLYLRVDDQISQEQEMELQSMIDASETFIGRKTGYWLTDKDRTYFPDPDGYIRVYDTPIQDDLSTYDYEHKNGYVVIRSSEMITLCVGYKSPTEIPQDLINACLQMLKVWYYESEKQVNTSLIPEAVRQVIWNRKRFII